MSRAGEHSNPAPKPPITRIAPTRRGLGLDPRELWAFRDLFAILGLRGIKLRYKQTAIGLLWVIIQPLFVAILFAVLFGRFGRLPSGDVPYVLLVYAGVLPWNLFSDIVQRGSGSLVSDSAMVSKTYFPRAILPLSAALPVGVDFCIAFLFFFVLVLAHSASLSWHIVAVPGLLLIAFTMGFGVVLAVSALNVFYRDATHALPFVMRLLFFASPVAYSIALIPDRWKVLYALNPLVGVIEGFRWALLGGELPVVALLFSSVLAILAFVGGALVFRRLERRFADVI